MTIQDMIKVAIFAACVMAAQSQVSPDCKADIVFVMDTSNTVTTAFVKEVELAEKIASNFDLGKGARHRVSLMEFAGYETQDIIINWGEHQNTSQELRETMENMKFKGGTTKAAKALQLAYSKLIRNKRRPNTDLIVLLIHDGISDDDPVPIAKRIRGLPRSTIITMAVGVLILDDNLAKLASTPDLVFVGPEVQGVFDRAIRYILPRLKCEPIPTSRPRTTKGPPLPSTPAPKERVQDCILDIMIILDASHSVYGRAHQKEVDHAVKLVNRLNIGGSSGARVGFIIFAGKGTTRTIFSLDQFKDKTQVETAMKTAKYIGGTTDIAEALAEARTQLSSSKGARPGQAAQVVLLLSDGITPPAQFKRVAYYAAKLKQRAQYVYAVAADRYHLDRNLRRVASSGTNWFWFAKQGEEERFDKAMEALTANC